MTFSFTYNGVVYRGEHIILNLFSIQRFSISTLLFPLTCKQNVNRGFCYGEMVALPRSYYVAVLEILEEEKARLRAEVELAELGRRWANLPHDLQIDVLRHLPLTSVFRLRLVCKKWNAMLSTASFLDHIGGSIKMDKDVTEFWFILWE
jgi:hypothetical protein